MSSRRALLHADSLVNGAEARLVDGEAACALATQVGVWISPRVFQRLPILLPHVVRDAGARGRSSLDGEQWASPNLHGYLRDDNSLIKEAVKSLRIESPRASHDGLRIGQGWVAAHVWQFARDGTRATVDATTNSFVPNLVWLPRSLARLSDVQGSRLQEHLIAIARYLYTGCEFRPRLASLVDATWAKLAVGPTLDRAFPDAFNLFEVSDAWIERRVRTIDRVRAALRRVGEPHEAASSLRPSRYRDGLGTIEPAQTESLRLALDAYLDALVEQARS